MNHILMVNKTGIYPLLNESGLIKIYSVFKKWGGINVFWQSYKPRFINH